MTDVLNEAASAPKKGRGIYVLPNLITIGGMFAGFYAIVSGLRGSYENAVIAIFIALIMDGLDGKIARWTHAQSNMGAQLDSLADMVSFGVAPAMIMYSWSLSVLGKLGWLVAFVYMVCTSLRLARFNSEDQGDDKRYFFGLNTPSSAALVASVIWTLTSYHVDGFALAIPMVIFMFLLSVLKVSTIRYRSFKDLDLKNTTVSLIIIFLLLMLLVLIALNPPETLLIIIFGYVISGPVDAVMSLWKQRFRRATRS